MLLKMDRYRFSKSKLRKMAKKRAPSNFEMCLEWVQILIMRLPVVSESATSISATKKILEAEAKIKRHV